MLVTARVAPRRCDVTTKLEKVVKQISRIMHAVEGGGSAPGSRMGAPLYNTRKVGDTCTYIVGTY